MGELLPSSLNSPEEKMKFQSRLEALMSRGKESQILASEQIEEVLVSIETQIKQYRQTVKEKVEQNYAKFIELMMLFREVDEQSRNSLTEYLEVCFKNGHWVEININKETLQTIKDYLNHLLTVKFNLQKIKKIGAQFGVSLPEEPPEVNNSTAKTTIFDPFLVHVNLVMDPGEFYIVRLCDEEKRNMVFASLKTSAETFPQPQPIKTGQMYAVLNRGEIWCRGVCGSPCGHTQIGDDPTETLYEFFLLDQGHSESIPSSLIKVLPADLMAHPPLAIECTLNQMNPVKSWTAQATTLFKKLTKRGPLDLKVFSQEGNVLNVDLQQIPCFADEGHVVSIRDILYLTEYNNPSTEDLIFHPHLQAVSSLPLLEVKVGSKLTGVLHHAITSTCMIIKTDTDSIKYHSMLEEMQDEYNDPYSMLTMAVYSPHRGEFYACCRKSEWCRIVIEETQIDGRILVTCVDDDHFFATLRKDLRILPPKFMLLPPGIVRCKFEGKLWNPNGRTERSCSSEILHFIKQFIGNPVTLFVTAILDKLKNRPRIFAAVIYEKNEKTSLNVQLCKKNLLTYSRILRELERTTSSEKENVNATSIVPDTSTELNETSRSVETSSATSVFADSIAKIYDSSLDPQDILPSSLCPSPVEGSVPESSLVVESYPIGSALPDSSPVEVTAPDSIPVKASIKDQTLVSGTSSATPGGSSASKSKSDSKKKRLSVVAETLEPSTAVLDDVGQLLLDNPGVGGCEGGHSEDILTVSGTMPVDEISLTVCFVHCQSPDSIFFRMPHLTKVYNEMMANLDHVYSNYKQKKNLNFEVNFACVVQNHGEYFRAEVIDIDEYPRCKVRLMDIGLTFEVQVTDIFPLLAPFDQIPRLAIHCSLHGIHPPGGVWDNYVQKRITELLLSATEISICKRLPLHSSSPMSVMVVYTVQSEGGPLELPGLKMINFNEQLVDLKLALNQPDPRYLSTGAMRTWTEPPYARMLPQFNALITWVNLAGEVFLYDINKSGNQLKEMQEQLDSIYEGTQPTEADLNCKSGDPCIARYKLDGSWYRATVLSAGQNQNQVLVFFVDYGTRDEVERHHIRLDITLESIPIQTIKCTVFNIKPNPDAAEWPIETLDYLHKLIVDQTCRVTVHSQSASSNVVSLNLPSGVGVAKCLIDKKMAAKMKTKPANR